MSLGNNPLMKAGFFDPEYIENIRLAVLKGDFEGAKLIEEKMRQSDTESNDSINCPANCPVNCPANSFERTVTQQFKEIVSEDEDDLTKGKIFTQEKIAIKY